MMHLRTTKLEQIPDNTEQNTRYIFLHTIYLQYIHVHTLPVYVIQHFKQIFMLLLFIKEGSNIESTLIVLCL